MADHNLMVASSHLKDPSYQFYHQIFKWIERDGQATKLRNGAGSSNWVGGGWVGGDVMRSSQVAESRSMESLKGRHTSAPLSPHEEPTECC